MRYANGTFLPIEKKKKKVKKVEFYTFANYYQTSFMAIMGFRYNGQASFNPLKYTGKLPITI